MKKAGGVLEGLILLAIGIYAFLLVFFGNYWRFLNPKFKWLTAATALVLMVVGVASLLHPDKEPKLSRIIIFLLLLRLFWVAPAAISPAHRPTAQSPEEEPSRVTVEGAQYIKINLAELYSLCREGVEAKLAMHYAVRGMVKRDRQLDRLGQFALVRSTVFCCLADAVGMGFRVKYDHVDKLRDGEWVEIFGTLAPMVSKFPDPAIGMAGMNITVLNDSCMLLPNKVSATRKPQIPFILDIKQAEPYAY
jgi:uncharacterized repeat protein (TIGR03943 family)